MPETGFGFFNSSEKSLRSFPIPTRFSPYCPSNLPAKNSPLMTLPTGGFLQIESLHH